MLAHYIKFLRGTEVAYNNLTHKDEDTLYFVTETSQAETGKLYLGNKLISAGSNDIDISDLLDIITTNVDVSSLLVYNPTSSTWEVVPVSEIVNIEIPDIEIAVMTGATLEQAGTQGLVPAPTIEDKDLYLKGSGEWGDPTASISHEITNTVITEISNQLPNTISEEVSNQLSNIGSDEIANIVNNELTEEIYNQLSNAVANEISDIVSNVSEDYNSLYKIENKIININNSIGDIENLGNPYVTPSENNPTNIINEINYINEYNKNEIYTKAEVDSLLENIEPGGGGGGGEIPSSDIGSLSFTKIGNTNLIGIYGQPCYAKYYIEAVDENGGEVIPTGRIVIGGVTKATFIPKQGASQIDLSPYASLSQTVRVYIYISADIGQGVIKEVYKYWDISISELNIRWNPTDKIIEGLSYDFNIQVSTMLDYTVNFYIDNEYKTSYIGTGSREVTVTKSIAELELTHGAHLITLIAITDLGESAPVSHKLIYVEYGNNDVIIDIDLLVNEMNQYDTLSIPIIIYDPNPQENQVITASLYEGLEEYDDWVTANGEVHYVNYTPKTSGYKNLIVTSIKDAYNLYALKVNSIELTGIEEEPGYSFKIAANEIANNDSLKNWTYKNDNNIYLNFSDHFDWEHGGILDENIVDKNGKTSKRNYIKIPARSFITIKNYFPFSHFENSNGFSFKIIFKVENCKKLNSTFLTCLNNYRGIILKPQQGIFSSNSDTLVNYCEDEYIELEFDVDFINNYITSWIDGVPAGIKEYASGSSLVQIVPQEVVIGSDDCDISLYLLRIYKKHLTDNMHLNNFILDGGNAHLISDRFTRNDILSTDGKNIDLAKLSTNNPNCEVYHFNIPKIPTGKKDKDFVNNCTYQRYSNSARPIQSASSVRMRCQGTSAMNYGISAYNLDAEFLNGFYDENTNQTSENWAMTEYSIPVNYFNYKVNVASCEGANNALFQEWYNRYVPHVTEYEYLLSQQNIDQQPRNSMEFYKPGIIFLTDHNTTNDLQGNPVNNNVFNDTLGYIDSPWPKMYAICNMGNSKYNSQVFNNGYNTKIRDQKIQAGETYICGTDYNPRDATVEVNDNSYRDHRMLNHIILDNEFYRFNDGNIEARGEVNELTGETEVTSTSDWHKIYEWRWGMDPNYQDDANAAWLRLVNWFADNNSNAATGDQLDNPVTFGSYTFRGYTEDISTYHNGDLPSYKQNGGYRPTRQILSGLTITEYADTYTHDTYRYRMAKMLSECEDYLIMDEIVFHYLFIERHCLVDNVAKNTFWHTEDFKHWSMIKDYDNDTADGIDNNGVLSFHYGYEPLDHIDYDITRAPVFNAADAVWLSFIDGLYPACKKVYQELELTTAKIHGQPDSTTTNAWDANLFIKTFNNWQNAIPERIWIEDYYRKYRRPHEVYGGNTDYFAKLAGGKKTYQTIAFEKYQQQYTESKYRGKNCENAFFTIRPGQISEQANTSISLKRYADGYINADLGTAQNFRQRIHAGEECRISIPRDISSDAICKFYSSDYITDFTDLDAISPTYIELSSGKKLQKLIIQDELLTNNNLNSINFSNSNNLLEYIEIQNCTNSNIKNLNLAVLENMPNLKYLNVTGSNFASINLAPNAPIETLALSEHGSLSLKQLYYVTEFSREKTLTENERHLNTIYLNDLDQNNSNILNSKMLIDDTITSYSIQNIDWTLTSSDLLDGETTSPKIKQLEILLRTDKNDNKLAQGQKWGYNSALGKYEYIPDYTRTECLTGTITIPSLVYNGNNALSIYERYALESNTRYPNIDIIFEGNNTILYDIQILDGNDNIVWKRKIDNIQIITEHEENSEIIKEINSNLFDNGPLGQIVLEHNENNISSIEDLTIKAETAQYHYDFIGWTLSIDGILQTEIIEGETVTKYYNSFLDLPTTIFNANIIITPCFNATIRTYTCSFYYLDYNNTQNNPIYKPLEQKGAWPFTSTYTVEFGTQFKDIFNSAESKFFYIPGDEINRLNPIDQLDKVYPFLGYSITQNINGLVSDTYQISSNTNFYAIFGSTLVDIKNQYDSAKSLYDLLKPENFVTYSIKTVNAYIWDEINNKPMREIANVCQINNKIKFYKGKLYWPLPILQQNNNYPFAAEEIPRINYSIKLDYIQYNDRFSYVYGGSTTGSSANYGKYPINLKSVFRASGYGGSQQLINHLIPRDQNNIYKYPNNLEAYSFGWGGAYCDGVSNIILPNSIKLINTSSYGFGSLSIGEQDIPLDHQLIFININDYAGAGAAEAITHADHHLTEIKVFTNNKISIYWSWRIRNNLMEQINVETFDFNDPNLTEQEIKSFVEFLRSIFMDPDENYYPITINENTYYVAYDGEVFSYETISEIEGE